jgi:hypothetical protein
MTPYEIKCSFTKKKRKAKSLQSNSLKSSKPSSKLDNPPKHQQVFPDQNGNKSYQWTNKDQEKVRKVTTP